MISLPILVLIGSVIFGMADLQQLPEILQANFTQGWSDALTGHARPNFPVVDPEANMDFCEISNYHGYNCEQYLHQIVTKDGFLLTLHRVNGRKGKVFSNYTSRPPVFVQHGLLCDSTSWIVNLPSDSLPFILSDAGFDVWVGNSRGNTYSRAHKTLKPHQQEFWAWSWDEMAMYDLPASLDFVISHTHVETIPYIGHSQGTLIAFTHLSVTPDTRISQLIAMGPVFNVGHLISPIKYLTPISNDIALVLRIFGLNDFLPNSWFLKWFADFYCIKYDPLDFLCSDILFVLAGFDYKQLNKTRLPVYISHTPAGTSVRNIMHFAQMYGTKKCSKYNYGSSAENMKHYGVSTPPTYNISNIKNTPVTIYWAQNDWIADPKDVQYIIQNLPTLRDSIYVPEWDHLDFLWAIDAKPVIYDKIVALLRKTTP